MTTGLLRRAALAALLACAASPAPAQSIDADSQDALVEPGARQYDASRPPPRPLQRRGQFRDPSRYGAASADLPATVPQQPGGFGLPYGGYGYPAGPDARSGYAGRDGYGSADGYGAGYPGGGYVPSGDGPFAPPGSLGGSGRAFVAPFGGGPGNQTPIPLGAGSLYSGSAVNGTAVGPQFSSQLPAYQERSRR